MELIVSHRRSGKTTALVEHALANPDVVIVTFSEEAAHRIRLDWPMLSEKRVMSWARYVQSKDIHSRTRPCIDELEMTLSHALGAHVDSATVDKDSVNILMY